MRIISKSEIDENSIISKKLKSISADNKSDLLSREVENSEYEFTVNTDRSKYIESEDGAFHSYTFLIERDEDNGLVENLVLSLEPDGTYKADVAVYDFTIDGEIQISTGSLEDFDTSEYLQRYVLSCTTTYYYTQTWNSVCECPGPLIYVNHETNCTYTNYPEFAQADEGGGGFNNTVWVVDGGGGSSSGTGTGTGNTGTGTTGNSNGPIVSSILIQAEITKLTNQTKNSLVKARIVQMQADMNSVSIEEGSEFRVLSGSGSSTVYTEHIVPISDRSFSKTKFPDAISSSQIRLHLHHNSENADGGKLATVPSMDDIVEMAKFYTQKSQINSGPSNGLIGANLSEIIVTRGGLYAIRISDEQKALDFYSDMTNPDLKSNVTGITYQKTIVDGFNTRVVKKTDEHCIATNCTDEQEAAVFELYFKEYMKTLDIGLDFYVSYETDSDGNPIWNLLIN